MLINCTASLARTHWTFKRTAETQQSKSAMNEPKMRPRPPVFRALGQRDPPPVVNVGTCKCQLIEILKHDSWAATGLYRAERDKIVVKFHRRQPLFILPTGWLGRWLAHREVRALTILQDLPGIPRDAGVVKLDGRRYSSAVAHHYFEGHPLHIDERPNDQFFSRLTVMIHEIHRRGMAYLDLNKRENIIVTEHGDPVLVDFQLHLAPPRWAARVPPICWLLRSLQAADLYHLQKHMLWHRPDLVPSDQRVLKKLRPCLVKIWRFCMSPITQLRRRLLVWLGIRSGRGLAISELAPEKAARLTLERRAADSTARLPGE